MKRGERMSEGIQYADRAAEEKTWRLQEVFDKQLGIPPSPDASVINPPGFEQVDTRVLLGKILHQLGIWDKAAEAFAEAKEKNGIVRPQLNCLCDVWGFWYWDFKIDHNIITANNNFTDIEFGIEESRKNQPHAILLMNGLHELALARIHMIKKDEQTGNVSKVSLDSALLHGMKAVEDLKRANQYPHYLYGLEVLAEIHLLANQTEMAKDVLDTLKAKLELGPSTMTPRKIDYTLLMADYNLRQGNCDRNKVKAELEVIQRQIENMGYDRRKAWLKDRVRNAAPRGGMMIALLLRPPTPDFRLLPREPGGCTSPAHSTNASTRSAVVPWASLASSSAASRARLFSASTARTSVRSMPAASSSFARI